MRISLKALFNGIAALGAVGICNLAEAANVGQCFDATQLVATMHAEQQSSMAFANEVEELPGSGLQRTWGWIFTKSVDGSQGYAIRVNTNIKVNFTQGCIMQSLHDVSLDDAHLSSVPQSALLPFDSTRSDMNDICSKEKSTSICGLHNQILTRWNAMNRKIMLHGTNVDGKLVTLVGTPTGEQIGALTETYKDKGILVANHEFQDVGYSDKAVAILTK